MTDTKKQVGYGCNGMFKLVGPEGLESSSMVGWTCVERFILSTPVLDHYGTPIMNTEYMPGENGGSSSKAIIAQAPRFVMFMDEKGAHAILAERNELLEHEKQVAEEKLVAANKELEGSKTEVGKLQIRLQHNNEELENTRTARSKAITKLRAMESDLGAARAELSLVREALGSQRMHEILAAKK